jgi:hypothetical protein
MAIMRNKPQALRSRVTKTALVADVGLSIVVFVLISHFLAMILFVAGLVGVGYLYYAFSQVMRTRGIR